MFCDVWPVGQVFGQYVTVSVAVGRVCVDLIPNLVCRVWFRCAGFCAGPTLMHSTVSTVCVLGVCWACWRVCSVMFGLCLGFVRGSGRFSVLSVVLLSGCLRVCKVLARAQRVLLLSFVAYRLQFPSQPF